MGAAVSTFLQPALPHDLPSTLSAGPACPACPVHPPHGAPLCPNAVAAIKSSLAGASGDLQAQRAQAATTAQRLEALERTDRCMVGAGDRQAGCIQILALQAWMLSWMASRREAVRWQPF